MKRSASLALLALVFSLGAGPSGAIGAVPVRDPLPVAEPTASQPVGARPTVVENVGQFGDAARFQISGADRTMWVTDDALWITLLVPGEVGASVARPVVVSSSEGASREEVRAPADPDGVNLRLSFLGASGEARLEPFDRQETHLSYFRGADPAGWRADVPVWGGVRYAGLYPGVDLELGGAGGASPRFVLHDGANADDVVLRVEGADAVTFDDEQLSLATTLGDFTLPLFALVDENGSAEASAAGPRLVDTGAIARPFASSPSAAPIVAGVGAPNDDLAWATFVGGGRDDLGQSVALDGSGASYVTGYTLSTDLPTTPGAFQGTCGSCVDFLHDSYVTKVSPDGSTIEYSTFLGGTDYECLYSYAGDSCSIAVDASGSAYVAGFTESFDFPTTPGAYDRTCNSCDGYFIYDAFLTKLNPTGTALVYSTFLGGETVDYAMGVTLDGTGAAYVTGRTTSTDFPTTPGAFQRQWAGGGYDAFVTKVKPNGSGLVYSTFLGGEDDDCHVFGSPYTSCAIAIDATGAAYVTGATESYEFPITNGVFDEQCDANCFYQSDAFVTKLNPAGTNLVWSTYLGGELMDYGTGIAVDGSGVTYVIGSTQSATFPTTPRAFQQVFAGDSDAFVAKLSADASSLKYSTYLGGTAHPDCQNCGDFGYDIALEPNGNVAIAGFVASFDFPTTPDAFQPACGGPPVYCGDGFVSRLSADGADLLYSTYLGGDHQDQADSIALDVDGFAYVTGYTGSADFPVTPGAAQTEFGGFVDAFVAKINLAGTPACTLNGTSGDDVLNGTSGDDVICGLAGNDKINGGGGDDLLIGGGGADKITGGAGADLLQGDAGRDRLDSRDDVRGNDASDGGGGKDTCAKDRGDTVISC